MKLLNQSLIYITLSVLITISFWSVIFYFNMIDEIEDSIDDGLGNYKVLILKKLQIDKSILQRRYFGEGNYAISPCYRDFDFQKKDEFKDTLMYMLNERKIEPVRMLTTIINQGNQHYKLRIISPTAEQDDLIEELFWSVIFLFLILVINIVIINKVLLRKLWTPFYQLLYQLKSFRLNKESSVVPVNTKISEFLDLQKTLEEVFIYTNNAYKAQNHFIENASHELQTPIALANAKLENLLESGQYNGHQISELYEVLEILLRLKQLNKSLLFLAKIENKQLFESDNVFVNGLVKSVLDDFSEFKEYKNINVSIQEKSNLIVQMDANFAHIIILNLIKNSLLHNLSSNGKVIVVINQSSIEILNSGINKPLQQDKIFDRFYKENQSSKGTGLGLSIIKAITDLYGFQFAYSFHNSMHKFQIDFLNSIKLSEE